MSIFKEDIWRDVSSEIKYPPIVYKEEKKESKYFSGNIVIRKDDILTECFGIIKNGVFIVYQSNKLLEVYDVVLLLNCYLCIEEAECKIFLYDIDSVRITFHSNTEIKIET